MRFKLPSSKRSRDELIEMLSDDPVLFDELMSMYVNEEVDELYGWPLTYVIERYPERGIKWVELLLNKLNSTDRDDAKRNITRSLQFVEIPEEHMSLALDYCYRILGSESEKTAARVFSMSVVYNITKKFPDLSAELLDTLTMLFPMASAGFQSRARTIIKDLAKK